MTDFIDFNQDPANDIDTAPRQYHQFNGKGVRVQVYWTLAVWHNASNWFNSWSLLKAADRVLRKYTMSLDIQPMGPIPARHTAVREQLSRNFEKAVGSRVSRMVRANGEVADFLGDVADNLIDEIGTTAQGLVSFAGAVKIPYEAEPPVSELMPLRSSLGTIADESRLIVVFAPIDGPGNGYTVLRPEWLPWVIVDPRPIQGAPDTTLIHEMGHACRLAHQGGSGEASSVPPPPARNIMYPLATPGLDRLWGWQADTIYDSYWCSGRRPTNWFDKANGLLPQNNPFLWDEPP